MPTENRSDARPVSSEDQLVAVDGYLVAEWSPDADHACGPTQVHLMMPLVLEAGEDPICHMALRMKSRRAIQELIDTLSKHRDSVFCDDG